MTMHRSRLALPLLLVPLMAAPVSAQRDGGRAGRPEAAAVLEVPSGPGIAWFGSWEAGLAEAKRTGRPILILSAAPQCQGVPGMW